MRYGNFTTCSLILLSLLCLSGGSALYAQGANDDTPLERGVCSTPQFRPLTEIRAGLQITLADIPTDCSTELFGAPRPGNAKYGSLATFYWRPANFFHQPLYFDDVPLERYGQSVCPHLQPVISGARFFITLPAVPYKMGVDHPCECVTILGKYRPGNCNPCVKEKLPLSLEGSLLQTSTALLFVFALP